MGTGIIGLDYWIFFIEISCKGAVKIYQAYESLLTDLEKNIS
jgi:hypothetical protein